MKVCNEIYYMEVGFDFIGLLLVFFCLVVFKFLVGIVFIDSEDILVLGINLFEELFVILVIFCVYLKDWICYLEFDVIVVVFFIVLFLFRWDDVLLMVVFWFVVKLVICVDIVEFLFVEVVFCIGMVFLFRWCLGFDKCLVFWIDVWFDLLLIVV